MTACSLRKPALSSVSRILPSSTSLVGRSDLPSLVAASVTFAWNFVLLLFDQLAASVCGVSGSSTRLSRSSALEGAVGDRRQEAPDSQGDRQEDGEGDERFPSSL